VTFSGSGGSIRAFPSSADAGVQYTFQLIVMDEFAFHAWAGPNWAALAPTASAGGQALILSTADPELGPAGAFFRAWGQASDGVEMVARDAFGSVRGAVAGLSGLWAVFIAVLARPDRDGVWLAREKARIGDSVKADAYYPASPAEAFVGRAGLVFPQFSVVRHTSAYVPKWQDYKLRVAGVDFGGGDPNAIVPVGITGDWRGFVPVCYYRAGALTSQDACTWLRVLHDVAPFDRISIDAGSGTATKLADLRIAGPELPFVEAIKARGARLDNHAWFLQEGRLTYHEGCGELVAEYAQYRWATRTDPTSKERYKTSTPVDHHADGIDAVGYALLEALVRFYGGGGIVPVYRIEGGGGPAGPKNWKERVEMTRAMLT
jgi:hypothetical protein